jgi:hypothetical protein
MIVKNFSCYAWHLLWYIIVHLLAHVSTLIDLLRFEYGLSLDLPSAHEKNGTDGNDGDTSKDGSNNDSGGAVVCLGGSILTRGGTLIVGTSSIVPETTNLLTGNSQVPVSRLEGGLDSFEASGGGSDLHAIVNLLSGVGVGSVDAGKDSGSENCTLGLFLLGSLQLVNLVCVTDSSLHERNIHNVHNLLLSGAGGSAVADKKLVLSEGEQIEKVVVDLGSSSPRVAAGAASGKVLAPLVCKSVKELSIAASIGTLHGSGVEGNTLVPSCNEINRLKR